jgi:hypothetical protein
MRWTKFRVGVVFALAAIGCESAIVGGSCQPGFKICGEECVNLQRDFRNCGACENLCDTFICLKGECEKPAEPDASTPDASDASSAD